MGKLLDTSVVTAASENASGVIGSMAAAVTAPRLEGEIPWTPITKPLHECRVALISTAGFYIDGDEPFDVDARDGDPSFRVFPSDVDPTTLRVAHTHYSHRYVDADHNSLLPLDRLRELEQAGVFSSLAPRTFSFGFSGKMTKELIDYPEGTAHALAKELGSDEVDVALMVPA